jgi:hypothetical protein
MANKKAEYALEQEQKEKKKLQQQEKQIRACKIT